MLGVIQQHREAVEGHPAERGIQLSEGGSAHAAGTARWNAAATAGYRNAQVTVLAPTGTIAFLMDCDTTGIEPDIALVKYKLLAGGGMLKIVNRTVPEALRRLGYTAQEIERIIAHIEKFDTIEDVEENGQTVRSGLKPEHLPVFDCAFKPYPRPAQHPLPGPPEDDGARRSRSSAARFPRPSTCPTKAPSRTSATPTCRPGRWASSAWPSTATARSARSR